MVGFGAILIVIRVTQMEFQTGDYDCVIIISKEGANTVKIANSYMNESLMQMLLDIPC